MSRCGYVVGVDGCKAGWLACQLATEGSAVAFGVYASFAELLHAELNAAAIGVDIPIGLRNDWQPRRCDLEARKLLGKRGSSVFPAPPRSLLDAPTYQVALQQSRSSFGRGLSQQTFHISKKILEVDTLLPAHRGRNLFEVHPELCFRQLGRGDLLHGKKTVEGYEERRNLLGEICKLDLPGIGAWRRTLNLKGKEVNRDDLLDAAAAAVTARRALRGEAGSLPETPELDETGLRMQILY